MAFLVEHLPPHVHVVLSTRADPDLPLARWRVRGELVEIRAADLRFTLRRGGRLPRRGDRRAARPPSRSQALEERTEGWIAALQLAAISLQGRDDVGGFIAGFAGDDRYVVDYLVEEVLAHQPRAGARLPAAVRGARPAHRAAVRRGHSAATTAARCCATLERANLFLVAAGRPAGVVPLPPAVRRRAAGAPARRAARAGAACCTSAPAGWYEQHDLTDEAVEHALAARDFDRAAPSMELAVPAIRRHRQRGDDARLARGPARRHGPAQPGAERLLRGTCSWSPATSTRSGPGSTTPSARWLRGRTADGVRPGPTPRSCAPCRRPSPSTGRRSPRPEATSRARRSTPGAPSTSPAPTTTSPAAAPPGSSGSPPGRTATCRSALETFGRRWRACTRPATSSTS